MVGYAVFLLGAILLGPGVSARVDRVPPVHAFLNLEPKHTAVCETRDAIMQFET